MYSVRRRGSLDPDELAASLHDYVVVDVRDRSGWSDGHIPGSIHVPINHIDGGVIVDDKRSPLAVLASANFFLMCFNLLPAYPLDGGLTLDAWLGALLGPTWYQTSTATSGSE